MKKRLLVLLFVMVLLSGIVGCSESQMLKGDKVATSATTAATDLQTAIQSPAGVLVPEPFRSLVELALAGILTAAGSWQLYRKGKVSAALDDLATAAAGDKASVLETPILAAINPATAVELTTLGH